MAQILNERIKELLSERRISKAEISEKLGIGYSTLWRRLNGERGINVDFLIQLASVLGTTASYLLGETNDPKLDNEASVKKVSSHDTLAGKVDNNSKETIHQEMPGHLVFKHGDYYVDIPDTPSNQAWFRELTTNMLMSGAAVS